MDIETYNRWEKMMKLREELLTVEEDRISGRILRGRVEMLVLGWIVKIQFGKAT